MCKNGFGGPEESFDVILLHLLCIYQKIHSSTLSSGWFVFSAYQVLFP